LKVPIRILLADDHQIVRQGIRALLEEERFEVVAEAADGRVALQLAEKLQPDVAILDLSMPGLNGVDSAREIRRVSRNTKTLLVTVHDEDPYILGALRAGVTGYVLKTQAANDLVQAVNEVVYGKIYLSPGISRSVLEVYKNRTELSPDPLSPRERQILQLVAEGKSTKEAASILGVSEKTAESHRTHLMSKLDIHQTAGLVRYAIKHGLVQA
jgi:two-component system response regulator NreC